MNAKKIYKYAEKSFVGKDYFNYLLKTVSTMNASFKYFRIIIPGKVEEC